MKDISSIFIEFDLDFIGEIQSALIEDMYPESTIPSLSSLNSNNQVIQHNPDLFKSSLSKIALAIVGASDFRSTIKGPSNLLYRISALPALSESVLKTTHPSRADVGRLLFNTFTKISNIEAIVSDGIQEQIRAKKISNILKGVNKYLQSIFLNKSIHFSGVPTTPAARNDYFSDSLLVLDQADSLMQDVVKDYQKVLDKASSTTDVLLRTESSLRMYLNFIQPNSIAGLAESRDSMVDPVYFTDSNQIFPSVTNTTVGYSNPPNRVFNAQETFKTGEISLDD